MDQGPTPQLDQLDEQTDASPAQQILTSGMTPDEALAVTRLAEQARLAILTVEAVEDLTRDQLEQSDVLLIGETSLDDESVEHLQHLLAAQPTWSELPLLLLADVDGIERAHRRAAALGNAAVLRRPVDKLTLTSVLQAALRTRRSQHRVRRLMAERRRASADRKRRERDAQFLAAASAALSSTLDYKLTLKTLTRLAVPHFADWCAVYLRAEQGDLSLLAVSHADPDKLALAREKPAEYSAAFAPPRGVVKVFKTGVPECVDRITEDMLQRAARDEAHLRQLRSMQLESYICVPMIARGETIGVITFVSAESGRRYTQEDLRFAHELASRAAVASENARLYEAAQAEIDERKAAERALIESRERLAFALSAGSMGTWSRELSEDQVYCSGELLGFFGIEPQDAPIPTERLVQAIHPEDRGRVAAMVSAAVKQHEQWVVEFRSVQPDGGVRWFSGHGHAGYDLAGNPLRTAGVVVEITQRKAAEEQLRALNETLEQRVAERTAVAEQRADQLRALAAELTQAEQRERRRLARMLHDGLQQLLVAAKLQLGSVRNSTADATVDGALQRIEQLLTESVEASRTLTIELSPPVLYDAGLGPALDWLARSMQAQHGLEVDVIAEVGDIERLAEDVKVLLFQAVRELLFNIVKHADSKRAQVVAAANDRWVRVVVSDEGCGFDMDSVAVQGGDHFGLFSLRERLSQIGGEMEITSEVDVGTRVKLVAPKSDPAVEPEQTSDSGVREAIGVERPRVAHEAGGRTRVLLADDHSIFREGLAGLLRTQPFLEVVGEASDGQQALEMARQLQPDVVIMDVTMPVMNGIEATRRISEELPEVRVIGLSMHQQADMEAAMREAGAAAYLPKGGPSEGLISMLRPARSDG